MVKNNRNKKLPRNRKRRIEQENKIDDKMKSLSNKIESEKEKKNKKTDKIKDLEIE